MRLSALQRYILRECYQSRKTRITRSPLIRFYKTTKPTKSMTDSLTQSLERLINDGLMIGYGRRTPDKWFIEEVKLTPLGRKTARRLLGVQERLPLK